MTIDESKEYDELWICHSDSLEENQQKITEKEEKNEKYQICINFHDIDTSIQQKIELTDMIDTLNLNHKVGVIIIHMGQSNPIDEKTIRMINQKYINLWDL